MIKAITLIGSHLVFTVIGFALGFYALPIFTAPVAPTVEEMGIASAQTQYKGVFRRDLEDSDFLHWGEGTVSIGDKFISLNGKLSPGPDYKLYLSPEFIETEKRFNQIKPTMIKVGDVKTFNNFILDVPDSIKPENYNTVVVWCETFGQFISAAKYK